ncbi:WHG domain-containing protein [Streptomyces mobaraensis NBRC 13819 = DSM 40847]|uniref:TetR family transcriptional regulator n=1 Tax=Streptomyces mobaraensis (strain ATCC 29032 / DSM 40847 / JCM 4168 / NBRC 13819 / NCIMB 11159 / IPCR 16-22) TaxID=1223523 RepID=M3CE15_STRM1|nr:TetR-like C-terminal domain-containing protein [Streptomyces mobaraensis]EMF02251.1 TetR family transcriptional regulator [Streptomyces mobaraensis NBRC 13819 = DSM 40847]QTT72697.1 WHG domain-containing protein [Streptomyces mobaraensis NBRC 13819 = DSM 40847]
MDTSGGDTIQSAALSTARQLLGETGAAGLTPDALTRASGLPAAEVAAVFPHRDDLLTALLIDAYDASAAALEEADGRARGAGAPAGARLLAVARAARAWSLAHPAEFALLYGSPVPGYHAPQETVPPAARTPAVLAGVLRSALEAGELTPPRRAVPGPPLIRPEAVAVFGEAPGEPFADLIERGIVLWSGLIGLLSFQVFSRTHDSVHDQEAFFDYAVAVMAEGVGLTVPAGE